MKKSMFAVAMVVVFIIAMAGTAYATWQDSGYTPWSTEASAAANGSPKTPHAGYTTSTKNCSVCHAVHRASSTAGAQVLLKSDIANACSYCHIDANADSSKKVYGGVQANYTNDIRGNHTTDPGCAGCHSVHSANTVGNGRAILLVKQGVGAYAGSYQETPTTVKTDAVNALEVTEWCSGCHPYYNTGYNGTSHVMKTEDNTYDNLAGSADGKDIASTGSEYCTQCHNTTVANGFPHFAPMQPRFLTDGATSTINTAVVNNDGPCLRCHGASVTGGMGVGTGF